MQGGSSWLSSSSVVPIIWTFSLIGMTMVIPTNIAALSFGSANLTCYCNNANHNGNNHRKCINHRCVSTEFLGICYVSKTGPGHQDYEYGCSFSPVCVDDDCRIECCRTHMCNKPGSTHLNISSLRYHCNQFAPIPYKGAMSKELIVVCVATPITLIIIAVMGVVMCKRLKRNAGNQSNHGYPTDNLLRPNDSTLAHHDIAQLSSAGSGTGVPYLSEQTISLQIVLIECVSKGKFGTVYHATWQQQNVAVKIFSTGEETSWYTEREIYHTIMLRHNNILGFIAADSKDTGVCTEYWLITEYHEKGSLYNYLQTEVLNISEMLKMAVGIASGLNHLHIQIVGNNMKPPIAHRDMKTKNILVKEDNTCCIADLGLAITKSSVCQGTVNSSRTGTRRYHSPELLSDTMDCKHFESFLKADIYALGLCFWEICWRTKGSKGPGSPPEYQLPYFDHVPVNPSEEDMLKVVCIEERRPSYREEWYQYPEMVALMKLMDECWCSDATARLPTLRIKKNVLQLFEDYVLASIGNDSVTTELAAFSSNTSNAAAV